MPGAIFLGFLVLFPPVFPEDHGYNAFASLNDAFLGSLYVAVSYALGVLFNLIPGVWKSKDDKYLDMRNLWPIAEDATKLEKLKAAYQATFGLELTAESWRLCYGIADKSGYGIRVDLFSSLNVFCRSLFVAMILLALIYLVTLLDGYTHFQAGLIVLCIFAGIGFARGARHYSRVFAAAIYESFLTWYAVEIALKANNAQPSTNPAETGQGGQSGATPAPAPSPSTRPPQG